MNANIFITLIKLTLSSKYKTRNVITKSFFPFAWRKSEGCFTQAVKFESCAASFLPRGLCHEHGEELELYELCVFNERKEFCNMV